MIKLDEREIIFSWKYLDRSEFRISSRSVDIKIRDLDDSIMIPGNLFWAFQMDYRFHVLLACICFLQAFYVNFLHFKHRLQDSLGFCSIRIIDHFT